MEAWALASTLSENGGGIVNSDGSAIRSDEVMDKREIFSSKLEENSSFPILGTEGSSVSSEAIFRFQPSGKSTLKLARSLGVTRKKVRVP